MSAKRVDGDDGVATDGSANPGGSVSQLTLPGQKAIQQYLQATFQMAHYAAKANIEGGVVSLLGILAMSASLGSELGGDRLTTGEYIATIVVGGFLVAAGPVVGGINRRLSGKTAVELAREVEDFHEELKQLAGPVD